MNATRYALIFLTGAIAFVGNAEAQFDLGTALKNGLRQGMKNVEGEVRGAIQNGIDRGLPAVLPPGGGHKILPYPPPRQEILPYPPQTTCPTPANPPITTLPYPPPNPGGGEWVQPQPPTCTIRPITEPTEPDPAPEPERVVVMVGQAVALDGSGFGEEPGGVFVTIGEMILNAELIEWNDESISARIPQLPLINSTEAEIAVVTATEEVAERLPVIIEPADDSMLTSTGETETEIERSPVAVGSELTIDGTEFGLNAGRAELLIGDMSLAVPVVAWENQAITLQIPALTLADSTAAQIRLMSAADELLAQLDVQLMIGDATESID